MMQQNLSVRTLPFCVEKPLHWSTLCSFTELTPSWRFGRIWHWDGCLEIACWMVSEVDLGIFLWNTKMGAWGEMMQLISRFGKMKHACVRACVRVCVHIWKYSASLPPPPPPPPHPHRQLGRSSLQKARHAKKI